MTGPFYIKESPSGKWSLYISESEGAFIVFYDLAERVARKFRDRLNAAVSLWIQEQGQLL